MSCLALRSEVSLTLPVIASVAKQPRGSVTRPLGCFVASLLTMTGSTAVENEA
jgi:hypothetical protein